ncbi:MAG TPA: trehalose-6-phosphate synthase [Acidimicrobiales bacterium]|nr:trehalose-6-phosphate synthase [Acidimicrobiales bacterium]
MQDQEPQRPDLVIVSNRGPVGFRFDEQGRAVAGKTAGGLASGLKPLVADGRSLWLAVAITEADRVASTRGRIDANGIQLELLDVDPDIYADAYDIVSNSTLWFLHHGLFDLARTPVFDRRWHRAWDNYRRFNRLVAEAVAARAPHAADVLVQDYHLSLVPRLLAELRSDLAIVHYTHTPFAGADAMGILPTSVGRELAEGLAGATACGFHTSRWRDGFTSSLRSLGVEPPATFVAPLAPDTSGIEAVAADDACRVERDRIEELRGDMRLIVRVDRLELSKNILRGFQAYADLLERRPDLHHRVLFLALVYPSRQSVPEYAAYRREVEALATSVNGRFGDADWNPIVLDTEDDFPRAVAGFTLYDVLLVNPVRDGLNLVAMEGPAVNEAAGVLVLSREAGSHTFLAGHCLGVNPCDVVETSRALEQALDMDPVARAELAAGLVGELRSRTPAQWLDAQIQAARNRAPSGPQGPVP